MLLATSLCVARMTGKLACNEGAWDVVCIQLLADLQGIRNALRT